MQFLGRLPSGETLSPGSQTAAFSLSPRALSCRHSHRNVLPVPSPLLKAPALLGQDPTLKTSFNLKYFLKGSSPSIVTFGVRASNYEFGEI